MRFNVVLNRFAIKISTIMLVALLCACGGVDKAYQNAALNDPNFFSVDKAKAKVFFYAFYDAAVEDPWIDETFRFYVDNGYIGDIGINQYITTEIMPGDHVFTVDYIGWSGYVIKHYNFKETVPAGQSTFLAQYILSDKQGALSQIAPALGRKEVQSRERVCPCGN